MHPVPLVKTPIELSAEDVAQVDTFVEMFIRLMAAGAIGAETLAPLIVQFGTNPEGPLELVTDKQQLYYRQLGIAIRKAGLVATGEGGGGGTTVIPPYVSQVFNATTQVDYGAGVFITTSGGVSNGDCREDEKSLIVGVSASTSAPGTQVRVVSNGTIAGVLTSAVPGLPYFLSTNGRPAPFDSLVLGQRAVQLGIARSATDLEVRLLDLGVR